MRLAQAPKYGGMNTLFWVSQLAVSRVEHCTGEAFGAFQMLAVASTECLQALASPDASRVSLEIFCLNHLNRLVSDAN